MKMERMILILTACGCLTLGAGELYAGEPPVGSPAENALDGRSPRTADAETGLAKPVSETEMVKRLDEMGAHGEKSAEAIKLLEESLKDKSALVRDHAAMALGAIGPAAKDSVTDLAELVKDPDNMVRRSGVRAIMAIHPARP